MPVFEWWSVHPRTYLVIITHELPIFSTIEYLCCPIIFEGSAGNRNCATGSIEKGEEVVRIELEYARVNVEHCTEYIEANVRDETACLEDDRATSKLVRLVGRNHCDESQRRWGLRLRCSAQDRKIWILDCEIDQL